MNPGDVIELERIDVAPEQPYRAEIFKRKVLCPESGSLLYEWGWVYSPEIGDSYREVFCVVKRDDCGGRAEPNSFEMSLLVAKIRAESSLWAFLRGMQAGEESPEESPEDLPDWAPTYKPSTLE